MSRNLAALDLFALFREVIHQWKGYGRLEWLGTYGEQVCVFRIQEVYIKLLGDMEDVFRNGVMLAKQQQAQAQMQGQPGAPDKTGRPQPIYDYAI